MLRKNVFKQLKDSAASGGGSKGFISPTSNSAASAISIKPAQGTLNRKKWDPNTSTFVSVYGENDPWGVEDTSFTKARFTFSENQALASKFGEGDFWAEEGTF